MSAKSSCCPAKFTIFFVFYILSLFLLLFLGVRYKSHKVIEMMRERKREIQREEAISVSLVTKPANKRVPMRGVRFITLLRC